MKEITRSIPVSTITCAKVIVKNDEFLKEELAPVVVTDREISIEKADKEVKNFTRILKTLWH